MAIARSIKRSRSATVSYRTPRSSHFSPAPLRFPTRSGAGRMARDRPADQPASAGTEDIANEHAISALGVRGWEVSKYSSGPAASATAPQTSGCISSRALSTVSGCFTRKHGCCARNSQRLRINPLSPVGPFVSLFVGPKEPLGEHTLCGTCAGRRAVVCRGVRAVPAGSRPGRHGQIQPAKRARPAFVRDVRNYPKREDRYAALSGTNAGPLSPLGITPYWRYTRLRAAMETSP